jgi:hypothetical protein
LIGINPSKELAICLTSKHVKPVRPIKMNISDLNSAALADSNYNVVLVAPNDTVWRRPGHFPEVMNVRTRDFPHEISEEAT